MLSNSLRSVFAVLQTLSRSIAARPRLWLVGIGLATLPLALGLPRIPLRTDGGALYPAADPVIEATVEDRAIFRDPEAVIVLVTTRSASESMFSPAALRDLARLTESLLGVHGVRAEDVISLATVVDVSSSAERIRVTRVLDPPPTTPAAAESLRLRLEREGLYDGLLFGRDGRSAAISLPIDPTASRVEVVRGLRQVARAERGAAFEVRLTGPVVAEVLLGEQILADLVRLVPIVVAIVVAMLVGVLRSVAGAVIPLLMVGAVLTWTFGAMAWSGTPLTLVTSILPVLLMAMAVTDQIHVLDRVQHHLGCGLPRGQALRQTYEDVGAPIARTALTTAVGFLAFTTASVPAMRHFGLFASFGLLVSLAFAFTLVPAALMVVPDRWLRGTPSGRERSSAGLEGFVAGRPRTAALVAVALVAVAGLGIARLTVQDSWVANFHPRSDLAVADREFNQAYLGSYRLDATLESDTDGFFRGRAGFRLVDSLENALARVPGVGGTRSLAGVARAALRGIDSTRSAGALEDDGIAQLFMVIEMSGSQHVLDPLVTASGRVARVRCYVPQADYEKASRLIARVDSIGSRMARAAGVRWRVTGDLAVATEVVRATVTNQVRSVAATTLGLFVLLSIAFASPAVAGIVLLPIVATTLVVLGGMGHAGVPLGVATSMFAALVEGEGVNYTIHVVSRFLKLRDTRPAPAALRDTLSDVGPAIRGNGLALVAGCLVLCFSTLKPVRALGGLLALGLALSYVLAFLILPVLLLRRGARASRGANRWMPAASLALALGIAATVATTARAAPPRAADDPRARRLMVGVERAQRDGNRAFAMDLELTVAERFQSRRRILGLAGREGAADRLLYVYASPRDFRGATLVLEDSIPPSAADRTWISLPALGTFREVDAPSMPLLVPGTGLTYEDARGRITPEKFRFALVSASARSAIVEARPRTDSLVRVVGAERLVIAVDPIRSVVTQVSFFDRAQEPIRTYEASEFVEVHGRWHPGRVRTRNRLERLEASIAYRYHALPSPPPRSLFEFDRGRAFLTRLLEWRDRAGLARTFPDTLSERAPTANPRR